MLNIQKLNPFSTGPQWRAGMRGPQMLSATRPAGGSRHSGLREAEQRLPRGTVSQISGDQALGKVARARTKVHGYRHMVWRASVHYLTSPPRIRHHCCHAAGWKKYSNTPLLKANQTMFKQKMGDWDSLEGFQGGMWVYLEGTTDPQPLLLSRQKADLRSNKNESWCALNYWPLHQPCFVFQFPKYIFVSERHEVSRRTMDFHVMISYIMVD